MHVYHHQKFRSEAVARCHTYPCTCTCEGVSMFHQLRTIMLRCSFLECIYIERSWNPGLAGMAGPLLPSCRCWRRPWLHLGPVCCPLLLISRAIPPRRTYLGLWVSCLSLLSRPCQIHLHPASDCATMNFHTSWKITAVSNPVSNHKWTKNHSRQSNMNYMEQHPILWNVTGLGSISGCCSRAGWAPWVAGLVPSVVNAGAAVYRR